ncbi:hypothetical protein MPNT_70036 [Candidatus Methylacidithermus pantelleriae]|uniref:Uncharacterized protein n=1 Tax=Candidatus Methylacidithermus pantelleriae TaxID=2744239 RepID=A0A8J2BL67_9BACT|nr:hypothetical protein MPNT_70036 [Candidatus Methylacidithermus pantelleriae]
MIQGRFLEPFSPPSPAPSVFFSLARGKDFICSFTHFLGKTSCARALKPSYRTPRKGFCPTFGWLLVLGSLCLISARSQEPPPSSQSTQKQSQTPGDLQGAGIVYGPNCAFFIKAPPHWVLDNESGQSQGLSCVFYPENSSWAQAETVIYAQLSGPEHRDAETFAQRAVKELLKHNPALKPKRLEKGKTVQGLMYLLYEYPPTSRYPVSERAAYVGLGCGVASLVMSSRNPKSYRQSITAFRAILDSIVPVQMEPEKQPATPPSGSGAL